MTIFEFLTSLQNLKIKIWKEGDQLCFKAPKGVMTPELRAQLIERKEAILLFLDKTESAGHAAQSPILPIKREGPIPLSFAQERLRFLDRLEPNNNAYNIYMTMQIKGKLDSSLLEQSLREVVRRHEVMRTVFDTKGDLDTQVIAPEWQGKLQVIDLLEWKENRSAGEIKRLVSAEVEKPFDLSRGPLLRASLLCLDQEDHVLVLNIHHIVSDGWSMQVLFKELWTLYGAHIKGEKPPLTELPIQYADFAAWQRNWLQGEELERQLGYWKEKLKGAPTALELHSDHARPPLQSYRGSREDFTMPQESLKGLEQLSQKQGTTLFMSLLAIFNVLLYRYTSQNDILVGTPIAGRNREDIEGLIGFFVNTLILRTDLSNNPTFMALLAQAKETALDAYAHQDLPFEKLVKELQPKRDMSRSPLFQVMFALQNVPWMRQDLPGIEIKPFEFKPSTSKFDLSLDMESDNKGLRGRVEYCTDLFRRETILRLIEHFKILVEMIIANPERTIDELPLLTQAEKQQMLVEWNNTRQDYPRGKCIQELFEEQVKRTPNVIAVIFEDQYLTYEELNGRANQLSHYLQEQGMGPERLVGICLERSAEMVIGLLGVLKAGGAYVPLDPSYPEERLQYMLEDSKAQVLLTQSTQLSVISHQPSGFKAICLDTEWETIAKQRLDNPKVAVKGENIAYVIYTSGSTGKPKGAMNTHAAICNRLLWMQDAYRLTEVDRVLQKTPISFDVSVWEFFWPLLTGATLVMARPEGHKDSAYLIELIAEYKITTLHFVPSMLQVFIEEEGLDRCDSLRRIICSGEALSFELREHCLARLSAELYNLYGPTEAAVDVTFWNCRAESLRRIVPIGRPIANIRIYLLDQSLNPVPVGVPGELHIGGIGLARGYLNRSGLTAEKFIPDPFSGDSGTRLYKTGDLASYLPDGNIEFLARLDHQIKIRGFRIELGEIEAVLREHPSVWKAAVLVREEESGNKRLTSYVVPKPEQSPTVEALRDFLKEKLPEYMVPSAFALLEDLPLTPSGKLDRRALLAAPLQSEVGRAYAAPRTPKEKILSGIWAEVLRLEKVGVHDNFFELGGDSILSIQVIARAKRAGVHLTAQDLFQHQTIAELAAITTDTALEIESAQGLVTGTVQLIPIQSWFMEQNLPEPQHWNQEVLYKVRQKLDPMMLTQAVRKLLSHHDVLRVRLAQETSSWHLEQAGLGEDVPCVWVDLSELAKAERTSMIEAATAEAQASLNLTEGPLLRVVLFDLGPEQEDRLLIIIHHLVVDKVSWWILLEDLQTACQQLSRGEAIRLPAKTTSFKHWSERLWAHAQSGRLEEEMAYWLAEPRKQVSGLPVDYLSGEEVNSEASERIVSVSLGEAETLALLRQAPQGYGIQINDILLTALAQAYARWTGEQRLLVDLEGHGREGMFEDVDLSRTVGWFTTIYPVLLEYGDADDLISTLMSIKAQLRGIPNRGIGYGLLRYMSGSTSVREQLRTRAQPEIIFNYLGQLDQMVSENSLFKPAPEPSGPSHSLKGSRRYLLEIDSFIDGGRLQLHWRYSANVHRRATIESLAENYLAALRSVIASGRSLEAAGSSIPSDFSLVKVDERVLDQLSGLDRQIEDLYPLTPMQRNMLYHCLHNPEPGLYVWHSVHYIRGINVSAFQQAWQQIIDRHMNLRTTFIWEGLDEPLQVVHKHVTVAWEQQDWRGKSKMEQEQRLEAYVQGIRLRGFKPPELPSMRVALFQIADDDYHLIRSINYMLLDGWSSAILWKEFFSCYEALCQGREPDLGQYYPFRDYIAWLRQQDISKAAAFWKKMFNGFVASKSLAGSQVIDNSLSQGDGSVKDKQQITLTTASTTALRSLSRRYHLTLNTLIQGAWAILLSCYTGEEDLVFGVTVSGRSAALTGVESMVGSFINTLPVRVRALPETSLLFWLQELQTRNSEIRQYEYTPLAQIKEWVGIPEKLPFPETYMVFENYPIDASLGEWGRRLYAKDIGELVHTEHPLRIEVFPMVDLTIAMTYYQHHFDTVTIGILLEQFKLLLENIAANPEQRLAGLKRSTLFYKSATAIRSGVVDNELSVVPLVHFDHGE